MSTLTPSLSRAHRALGAREQVNNPLFALLLSSGSHEPFPAENGCDSSCGEKPCGEKKCSEGCCGRTDEEPAADV
ncbi:MAG: hypothetical protein AB1344_09930 [Pseudomonadota bacterium]